MATRFVATLAINWDLIPQLVISTVDTIRLQPLFGLNTFGRALLGALPVEITYQTLYALTAFFKLGVTVAGRFQHVIKIRDRSDVNPDLSGDHSFDT